MLLTGLWLQVSWHPSHVTGRRDRVLVIFRDGELDRQVDRIEGSDLGKLGKHTSFLCLYSSTVFPSI